MNTKDSGARSGEYVYRRVDFVAPLYSSLVELTARLFANWLYVEKLLTNEGKTVFGSVQTLSQESPECFSAILQVLTRIDSQLDRSSHFVRSQTYVFDLA